MSCMTHGHQWTYGQAFSEANMQLSSATPSVLVQHVATLAMWRGLWTLWSTQVSKQTRQGQLSAAQQSAAGTFCCFRSEGWNCSVQNGLNSCQSLKMCTCRILPFYPRKLFKQIMYINVLSKSIQIFNTQLFILQNSLSCHAAIASHCGWAMPTPSAWCSPLPVRLIRRFLTANKENKSHSPKQSWSKLDDNMMRLQTFPGTILHMALIRSI